MDPSDEPPDDLRVRLKWPGAPDTPNDDIDHLLDDARAGRAREQPGRRPPSLRDPVLQVGGTGPFPPQTDYPDDYPTYESAEVTDAEVDYPAADDRRGSSTEDTAQADPRLTFTSQQLVLAARSDSLQAALASIALRIDALTSTTSTFRNLVSDRLTDYAEQVGRLAAGAAGDLDDYRHLHERSIEQIRHSVGEAEDHVRRLTRTVGDLEQKTVALVAAVRENGDAVDHLLSERDQVSDTLLRSLDRVGVEVQTGLQQGLGEATASIARLEDAVAALTDERAGQSFERLEQIVEAMAADRERQQAATTQLEQSIAALTEDREQGADAIGRLNQAITVVTAGQDRGLGKLASRIEARMDQLAGAAHSAAGNDLGAILTRLDARLKELSTDLVSGRDRETARALAQLSAQVDGLAGMVAEARPERETVEARLHRLSRPAAPALDLTELYARLDEMAGALAEYVPPDLRDLHVHLDEVAQTLSGHSAGVDPELTAAIERLERLVPAAESGPVRRGRPGDPVAGADELLARFDQLGQDLGSQIEALRRRIALRARPASQALDDQVIAAIADAVIARLGATEPPGPRSPAPPAAPRPAGMVSGEQRRRGPGGT